MGLTTVGIQGMVVQRGSVLGGGGYCAKVDSGRNRKRDKDRIQPGIVKFMIKNIVVLKNLYAKRIMYLHIDWGFEISI